MIDSLQLLTQEIVKFRDAREWEQFHTPRNLSTALAIEAGELQETMLWKSEAEIESLVHDSDWREKLSHELADVMIYALLLSHSVGVDPATAIREKLRHNDQKYPVERAKGNARKYDEV